MKRVNLTLENIHKLKQNGYNFQVKSKSSKLVDVLDNVVP